MTFAPQTLLDLRAFFRPLTGLDDKQLGIVGDVDHHGGYHHGKTKLVPNDYSNRTGRDRAGLTDAASAFDLGMFPRLRELSTWSVRQCQAGHPDTQDIREIIYSPDGVKVWRWDREHGNDPYISGDPSHLTHTHFSFYRDSENRDKRPMFRRFFGGQDMTTRLISPLGGTAMYMTDGFNWRALADQEEIDALIPIFGMWTKVNPKFLHLFGIGDAEPGSDAQAIGQLSSQLLQIKGQLDNIEAALPPGVLEGTELTMTGTITHASTPD